MIKQTGSDLRAGTGSLRLEWASEKLHLQIRQNFKHKNGALAQKYYPNELEAKKWRPVLDLTTIYVSQKDWHHSILKTKPAGFDSCKSYENCKLIHK